MNMTRKRTSHSHPIPPEAEALSASECLANFGLFRFLQQPEMDTLFCFWEGVHASSFFNCPGENSVLFCTTKVLKHHAVPRGGEVSFPCFPMLMHDIRGSCPVSGWSPGKLLWQPRLVDTWLHSGIKDSGSLTGQLSTAVQTGLNQYRI